MSVMRRTSLDPSSQWLRCHLVEHPTRIHADRDHTWEEVWVGAVIAALLFTLGKHLISLYIGSSNMASAYGAAGALIIVLVWVYSSAQIFLLGAEFAKAYSDRLRALDKARQTAQAVA